MNQFLVALVAVILVFAALRAHADETWDLTLEAGDQFDSNVHRTTGDGVPADGARTAARFDLADNPTAKTLLKLDAIGAAEAFAGSDPSTEDIGVVAGDARFVGFVGALAPGFPRVVLRRLPASRRAHRGRGRAARFSHRRRRGDPHPPRRRGPRDRQRRLPFLHLQARRHL